MIGEYEAVQTAYDENFSKSSSTTQIQHLLFPTLLQENTQPCNSSIIVT